MVEKILESLKLLFGQPTVQELDEETIQALQKLNKTGRASLRNKLIKESLLLEKQFGGEQAILWLSDCFKRIEKHTYRFNRAFFTPEHNMQEIISAMIKHTSETLDLCVFTITNSELADEIIECKKRGARVRIITDDEKIHDRGSEIRRLERAGIPIKTDHSHYHMHNKFGVLDNRLLITGSFNWTYTANKHNQENLLATTNSDLVAQYQYEFERLWNEMYR